MKSRGLEAIKIIRIGADWNDIALKEIDNIEKELKALEILIKYVHISNNTLYVNGRLEDEPQVNVDILKKALVLCNE